MKKKKETRLSSPSVNFLSRGKANDSSKMKVGIERERKKKKEWLRSAEKAA